MSKNTGKGNVDKLSTLCLNGYTLCRFVSSWFDNQRIPISVTINFIYSFLRVFVKSFTEKSRVHNFQNLF